MHARRSIILFVTPLILAGCTSHSDKSHSAVRGISQNDAAAMNAKRNEFQKTEDQPFTAQTHFAAAQLAESQGAPATAVERYNAVLKSNPRHLPSLYRLGILYAQAKAYPQAVGVWTKYLEYSNGDATGYANLGFCHELAGQPAEAETAYQRGIARDPKSNPCRVNYGLMLARTNRVNEAIIQLQAVLPEAQVYYNLASMHEIQGRREEARAAYRRAAELDPGLLEAKTRLAALD